jgi:SAM-dependent methyltransferase
MADISHTYYDDSYFSWQSPGGLLSARLDCWKFEPFLTGNDVVLDFGCGGGYMLAALDCGARYGVEINPAARKEAERCINVYPEIEQLPRDVAFDVVISHHALEHVDHPLEVLQKLRARLKPSGRIVFVVPSEEWRKEEHYRADDINQHLYTWTPLLLGNLFSRAGYHVERCELLRHRWLPKSSIFYRMMPSSVFHFLCRVWGTIVGSRQIRIVASRLTTN